MPVFRFDGSLGLAVYEGQIGALQLGKFSSTSAGKGLSLTKTNSFAFRACTDDNGSVFSSGASVRAAEHRLLLTAAHTGNVSMHGSEGHLKVASDCSGVTGYMGGTWGYIEMVSGAKVNVAGAVRSMLDCPSGATISGVLSAFLAAAGDISGTHTGPAVVLHIPNPTAGTFDALLKFGSATGVIATQAGGTLTITKKIPIVDDAGNTIYIAAGTIA